MPTGPLLRLGADHSGKSWFTIFRLYGPLHPWFDKTWNLNDVERVNDRQGLRHIDEGLLLALRGHIAAPRSLGRYREYTRHWMAAWAEPLSRE
jgi:hypothetical protein